MQEAARTPEQLRVRLVELLRPVFHDRGPWSMVDFPDHFNCGDAAIWLGQSALARQLGHEVRSVSSRFTYGRRVVHPEGVIVIQGGGNFGGLYPAHHDLRLRILHDFPERTIVQMPQSVEFSNERTREELRRAIGKHRDFTLLVRDARSFSRASGYFDCRILLVPDVAFSNGEQVRGRPRRELVVQRRSDAEAAATEVDLATCSSVDWLQPSAWELRSMLRHATGLLAAVSRRTESSRASQLYGKAADGLAQANLRRGLKLVTEGQLFITDRLHGHLLASLAGVPHIVVNDRYGKVEALWNTWTSGLSGSHFATSWARASDQLKEWAHSGRADTDG